MPSLSLALHTLEPVAGMDSGKIAKNSIQFQILNHFPNVLLSCGYTYFALWDEYG